jgi:hypothetical protein
MERFSEKLRKLGAVGDGCTGPSKVDLLSLLDAHRLNEDLNKRRGDRGVENGASIPV